MYHPLIHLGFLPEKPPSSKAAHPQCSAVRPAEPRPPAHRLHPTPCQTAFLPGHGGPEEPRPSSHHGGNQAPGPAGHQQTWTRKPNGICSSGGPRPIISILNSVKSEEVALPRGRILTCCQSRQRYTEECKAGSNIMVHSEKNR